MENAHSDEIKDKSKDIPSNADRPTENNVTIEDNKPAEPCSSGASKKKKKKKSKGAKQQNSTGEHVDGQTDDISNKLAGMDANARLQMQKALENLIINERPAKTTEDASKKKYAFWETQPVPKLDENVAGDVNEPVEPDKEEVRKEPYTLPSGFVWDTLDLDNPDVQKELYQLLNENYVEDDDNMFRFDYSVNFLLWALKPPGWKALWHCGVRVSSNRKLVGFISAAPARIKVFAHNQDMVEINFLCVHKKLRSKRVAPVLIKEITRRVNVEGIFQAVYTAGIVLPRPIATCRYWHRSLNPAKLVAVKFSYLGKNMTLQRTMKLYRLPSETVTPGLRPMTAADIPKAHKLLSDYLLKFELAPMFSEEDFTHWFFPREGIINTYVVESSDKRLTGLISFYILPSTIVHHPKYKTLNAAYAFYNVATEHSLQQLMNDALILAKNGDCDVFNALDLMENSTFLENLKFGIGDGNLNYYLYNWRCPTMKPHEIGLVLQ